MPVAELVLDQDLRCLAISQRHVLTVSECKGFGFAIERID